MHTLKIEGAFNTGTIADEIQHIPDTELRTFHKELFGTQHSYLNAMDRIIKVATSFKNNSTDLLLEGSRKQAQDMYDKFYQENSGMTDFIIKNRFKVINDKKFFERTDYAKLKKLDGSLAYTKQELYVLNELGGGLWLRNINQCQNTNDVISKIENIIKKAILSKYTTNGIESKKMKKLIGNTFKDKR